LRLRALRDAYNGPVRQQAVWRRLAIGTLALSLSAFSIIHGVRAAAGSDSFGYVSQAYLWLEGSLVVTQPPLAIEGVSHRTPYLEPLAYRAGARPGTLVPVYPPGLPLVMAAFILAAGTWGPFLVAPFSAGLIVLGTYLLGRRLFSTSAGLAAALLIACSPAVVFQSLMPMSDLPAAAVWTFSLLTALGPTRGRAAAAGLLAGAAILIRPNLAPLALFGALVMLRDDGLSRRGALRIAIYAAAAIPPLALLAWFNAHVYGSVMSSGYPDPRAFYALAFTGPNIRNYPHWFAESQGTAFAALVVYAWVRGLARRSSRGLAAFAAATLASYLPFLVFVDWWYLRFLLPAYPVLFVLAAGEGAALVRRLPGRARVLGGATALMLFVAQSGMFLDRVDPLQFQTDEHRYAAIGLFARDELPPNAAFLSMQHSGSLRFYAGRMTVRYDWLSGGDLPRVSTALEKAGYVPFLAIDAWEEQKVRARFTAAHLAFLDHRPDVELLTRMRVRIYRLDGNDGSPDATVYLRPPRSAPAPPALKQPVIWDVPVSDNRR